MKKLQMIFALIILMPLIHHNYAFGETITIVKNRQANAIIVIEKNASPQIRNVAKILQDYIQKSTGANLSIQNAVNPNLVCIHLGNTNYVKSKNLITRNLDQDGYILKNTGSKNFIILGKTDWGTEFGVYEFLERFVGVRWLMPSDLGTDIPKLNDLIIPDFELTESPIYLSRYLSPINIDSNTDLGLWGRFNRTKKNVEFTHNLNKLFDVKEFGRAHPEIYPTLNNRRIIPSSSDHNWQPNFTSPEIDKIASNKIIQYFRNNPKASSYSLGMNDSRNFDQSVSSTRKRSRQMNRLGLINASNDYYSWANSVAKEVNAVYPDKIFGTLAYHNLIDPPSTEVGINSNIIPFITSERMRWSNNSFKRSDMELTESWTLNNKSIGWYDYTYGLCYLVPRVWFHTMQEYLKWGSQNNVKYYVTELYPNWGDGPKAWLLAKLLWNPNKDPDVLLDEWYNRVGGSKAAPKLRAYYSLWEGFWKTDIQKSSWFNIKDQYLKFNDLSYMNVIPENYINQSDQLLNDAYSLADSPIRKRRVEVLLKMWKVYKYSIQASQKFDAKYLPTLKKSQELMAALMQLKSDSIHDKSAERILMYISPTKK